MHPQFLKKIPADADADRPLMIISEPQLDISKVELPAQPASNCLILAELLLLTSVILRELNYSTGIPSQKLPEEKHGKTN